MRFGSIEVSAVTQRSRRLSGRDSDRAIETISKVAQARQDELLPVELAIDDGCKDWYGGICRFDSRDAFGSGDDADQPDVLHAGLLQKLDGRDRTAACREHGIDD